MRTDELADLGLSASPSFSGSCNSIQKISDLEKLDYTSCFRHTWHVVEANGSNELQEGCAQGNGWALQQVRTQTVKEKSFPLFEIEPRPFSLQSDTTLTELPQLLL
jgi:hypothetical protein